MKIIGKYQISNAPANSNGFSMIEIISVLIIIGILSAVAIPKMLSTDVYDVLMETETLKAHLRYSQIRAMSHNEAWGIEITGSTSYTLQKNASTAPVNFPNEDSATHSLTNGVRITSGNTIISFDDLGSPGNTDINIILSNQGGNSRTLKITQETGFIY
jgi:MSHA pilin protein MshC